MFNCFLSVTITCHSKDRHINNVLIFLIVLSLSANVLIIHIVYFFHLKLLIYILPNKKVMLLSPHFFPAGRAMDEWIGKGKAKITLGSVIVQVIS